MSCLNVPWRYEHSTRFIYTFFFPNIAFVGFFESLVPHIWKEERRHGDDDFYLTLDLQTRLMTIHQIKTCPLTNKHHLEKPIQWVQFQCLWRTGKGWRDGGSLLCDRETEAAIYNKNGRRVKGQIVQDNRKGGKSNSRDRK